MTSIQLSHGDRSSAIKFHATNLTPFSYTRQETYYKICENHIHSYMRTIQFIEEVMKE